MAVGLEIKTTFSLPPLRIPEKIIRTDLNFSLGKFSYNSGRPQIQVILEDKKPLQQKKHLFIGGISNPTGFFGTMKNFLPTF